MSGYLPMLMNIILFIYCEVKMSESEFNLFNTEESLMLNRFDYNCLYFDQSEYLVDAHRSLIPFCIRPQTPHQSKDGFCYGQRITFQELKSLNVNPSDLFHWNGVIEIIDFYEKYLLSVDQIDENEYYCNCSSLSRFGQSCEYEIDLGDNQRSFTDLFIEKDYYLDDQIKNEYFSNYIGIRCETNLLNFDWRQICNGIVDCDDGEDEPFELCLKMELNQCDTENEFRCKTGLCILKSFGYDEGIDCPDRSDGINIYNIDSTMHLLSQCHFHTKLDCDETNYGWKRFSCGNGQFISYSDITSKMSIPGKTCSNEQHLIYLRNLFSSRNRDECWKSMICLTGFDYLYLDVNCFNKTTIEESCPNEFHFPPNSVVYSFVYFVYEKKNLINSTGPNFICYEKQFCNKTISNRFRRMKDQFICFNVDQNSFSWTNFIEYIIDLFSSCYSSNVIQSFAQLYKCGMSDRYVSIYRLKDKRRDCYSNEDENEEMNICSLNRNDQFKCLTKSNECIRELFVRDKENDCSDGTDEYIDNPMTLCFDSKCLMYFKTLNIEQIYRFDELCDQIVNRHLFSIESNETDESDCEYWPLKCSNSSYSRCNQLWNCENGLDEMNCPMETFDDLIRSSFNCTRDEHYCIQFIDNTLTLNCLNLNKSGDGIVDCIGATDERLTNICIDKYPIDYKRRFYCLNSSECIRLDQVCDTIVDCPLGDDERICPWLIEKDSSKFSCENSGLSPVNRCDRWTADDPDCQMKEQLWFCDLVVDPSERRNPSIIFEQYPKDVQSNQLLFSKRTSHSLCNGGYPIQSNNQWKCLCSPSFYGDFCQYQSERLTLLMKIELQYDIRFESVFRLIIYLFDENGLIISHDEILYNRQFDEQDEFDKILVYLIDERMANLSLYDRSKSKSVRIDSFLIKETNIEYISSWLYHVSFPFLPVNRLVVQLFLEDESFQISKCKRKCGSHGKCMYYINSEQIEYCWCSQGWFGEKCHLKSSACNSTSCAPHSHCVILNDEKQEIKCICPLGRSGRQCYIKYNSCQNVQCRNNGTCLPLDQRNFGFICICQDGFKGKYCEQLRKFSYISIPANLSHLSPIPVVTVMLGDLHSMKLKILSRFMYKNIFLPNILRFSTPNYQRFGFVRIFNNVSDHSYYLIVIQNTYLAHQINTSLISHNLCPNVSDLFNETILYEYSYLKRLKLYHLPCQWNRNLRCFFDEYRMCLCTEEHTSDCHLFHHEYNDCDYCKNDGFCVRENPYEKRWNFMCLCPKCSFGRRCQFTSENYFITLDMLLGSELKRGDTYFNQQSFIIYLTLVILILILIISCILNTTSIIIFSNKKIRQVGCDLYLLYLTIISQIGLIVLFLKFIFMIIIQVNSIENDLFLQINCILVEYLLRLIPSLFDWLTVCISIERAYTIIKDVHFTRIIASKTLKTSRWIILGVFFLNILSTFHRPFYFILIDDDAATLNNRKPGHPWCVLDFGFSSWNTYEKIINIIHLVMPFMLNLLSILLFLLRKIKSESRTVLRKTESGKFSILKEQLSKYQHLVMGTIIITILEVPRFIFTFALSCIEQTWQRYAYLTGYLMSFLPLTGILFLYIIPSPKYKEQLRTILKKEMFTFSRSIEL